MVQAARLRVPWTELDLGGRPDCVEILGRRSLTIGFSPARKNHGPLGGASPLRHCFATDLIEGGYDIPTVQELLGHNGVKTTMIYTHVPYLMRAEN